MATATTSAKVGWLIPSSTSTWYRLVTPFSAFATTLGALHSEENAEFGGQQSRQAKCQKTFFKIFFLQSLINKKIIRKWSPWSELFKYLLIFRIWKTRHLLFIFEYEHKMHLFSLLLSFAQLYVHYLHARIKWIYVTGILQNCIF